MNKIRVYISGFRRYGNAFLSVVLAFSLFFLIIPLTRAQAESPSDRLKNVSRPRLANYYVNWDLKAEDLPDLAHWNLVILDMEHQVRHPEYIKKLRELNPSIVILAYITSQEITDGSVQNFQTRAPLRYELFQGIRPEWYLANAEGKKFSFWQQTYMLNITADCPVAQGHTWNSYLTQFVVNRLAASGLWDGVLYDNVWQNVDWFTKTRGGLDINRDGKNDDTKKIDGGWRKGYETLLAETKRLAPPGFLVFANLGLGHSVYASSLNGGLFEHFPGFGWTYSMREATTQLSKGLSPFVILNSTSKTAGDSNDWRAMRFGFTSAMLIDAFFSFDHGDQHAEKWWYDEYGVDLGQPLTKAYSVSGSKNFVEDSVWRRDFTRGIVLTNSSPGRRVVKLDGTYKKIKGTQDIAVNTGETVTTVTLESRDGIVLLKMPTIVADSVFINGARTRTVTPSGVFGSATTLFSDAAPSGVPAFVGNIMNDAEQEGVKISGAKLEIWSGGKLQFFDYPFNTDYQRGMALAIAKPVSGKPTIFALAQKVGGQVVIYDTTGKKLVTVYPLGINYQGGFSLAFADVQGDGQDELIVGTGKGEPSQILVYDQSYVTIVSRLNPFDAKERSGIAVAALKPAQEGAVAFAALSQGSQPLLRTFTLNGKKLREFSVKRTAATSTIDIRAVPGKNPLFRVEEY